MAFVFRILLATGKFVIAVIVILVVLFILAWVINRGVQMFAEYFGYEVGDFFAWLRSKLPKRNRKRGKIKSTE